MEDFIKIIRITIWPIATIILACIFKKPLSDLISKIVKIKYKHFEAQFAKRLDDLKKDEESTLEEILESPGLDLYVKLAKIDPRSAVTESWRKLALAIQEKGKKLGVRHNIRKAIEVLSTKELIDSGEKHMINELRALRNEIEYAPSSKLTFLDAIKYAELAVRLTRYIQDRNYKK